MTHVNAKRKSIETNREIRKDAYAISVWDRFDELKNRIESTDQPKTEMMGYVQRIR